MAFKDEIIADMQATISRLTGELVERSSFEFKLMERISFLQQQLQKQEKEQQEEKDKEDRVNNILQTCIKATKGSIK